MKRARFTGSVINKMQLKLPALSANEGMARAAVAAFCAQLDPAAVEIADIKCAVSEAVTNCIVHAYKNCGGKIYLSAELYDDGIKITVRDKGCGIEDVEKALEPLYTTDQSGDRSGMGFAIMGSFTDKLKVYSKPGSGTRVVMRKKL